MLLVSGETFTENNCVLWRFYFTCASRYNIWTTKIVREMLHLQQTFRPCQATKYWRITRYFANCLSFGTAAFFLSSHMFHLFSFFVWSSPPRNFFLAVLPSGCVLFICWFYLQFHVYISFEQKIHINSNTLTVKYYFFIYLWLNFVCVLSSWLRPGIFNKFVSIATGALAMLSTDMGFLAGIYFLCGMVHHR